MLLDANINAIAEQAKTTCFSRR